VITRLEAIDIGSHGINDACCLMAQQDRNRGRKRAIRNTEVGVADPAVRHLHPDLTASWFLDIDRFT
jgi:hypothetical protein